MNTYGKCPQCGTDSISRERRPNGNDKCANGHTYPSANAIQSHSGGEALSQPNEPVAEVGFNNDVVWIVEDADNCNIPKCGTKLFLAPPNLEAKIAELEAENENLRTVMMAAAVEIIEHWYAYCDEEGYGCVNLVRRLENGYPERYGYDANTVVNMDKQIAELTNQNQSLVDDVEILTAKCEKMQKLLDDAPKFFSPIHGFNGEKSEWIISAEECK